MYREVTMLEITEVLRLWLGGMPKKRIAAQLGLDPKTVRHYVAVATGTGLQLGTALTDAHIRDVLLALHPSGGRPRGDSWSHCVAQRQAIERWLAAGRAPEQGPQAARSRGRRDSVPHAASVRRPGAALWPHGAHDPGRRWRAR